MYVYIGHIYNLSMDVALGQPELLPSKINKNL